MIKYHNLITQIDSTTPTGACLVAMDGDQVVGALGLSEPGAFINSLFVAESHRGQGIGKQLLQEAGRVATAHDKPTIGLQVCDNNAGAQKLYRSMGFRPFSSTYKDYEEYVAMLPLESVRAATVRELHENNTRLQQLLNDMAI